jgi:lipopolysaccharide/colanic/teichoic acid biosynthesis glycosyltransferase
MTIWGETAKRGIDIAVSATGIAVFAPLFLLIALGIRFDSRGRAIFRQQRLGRGGVPFTLYKFRTMVENAPDFRNLDGSTFNSPRDRRVTRLGRALRSSSLDELPQLFNIVSGAMSLVGPRPDQVDQASFYSGDEWRRNSVKPGITGLAQVSGRNAIRWADRKQLDLEYVARQSVLLDFEILLATVPCVLTRRGVFVN